MSKPDQITPASAPLEAKRPSWRLQLIVAGAMFLSTLAMCEGLLRLLWHNSYRHDSAEYIVPLRVQPANRDYQVDRSQLDTEYPRVRIRTDARSYLLPAKRHDQPDATIAFLGGSTTECVAVREELRFPAFVGQLLEQDGLNVNIQNAARSGNTMHDSINMILNHVVTDHPDIIVAMHSANDVGILAAGGDYSARSGRPMQFSDTSGWLKQKATQHCYLFALLRNSMAPRIQSADLADRDRRTDPNEADKLPIEHYRARLQIFVDVCRRLGIRPVLMTEPFTGAHDDLTPKWADLGAIDRFNAVIREVGLAEKVTVIDLVTHLQESVPNWKEPMHLFYDGIHVTDTGSQTYARYIAEQLRPLVEEKRRQASP